VITCAVSPDGKYKAGMGFIKLSDLPEVPGNPNLIYDGQAVIDGYIAVHTVWDEDNNLYFFSAGSTYSDLYIRSISDNGTIIINGGKSAGDDIHNSIASLVRDSEGNLSITNYTDITGFFTAAMSNDGSIIVGGEFEDLNIDASRAGVLKVSTSASGVFSFELYTLPEPEDADQLTSSYLNAVTVSPNGSFAGGECADDMACIWGIAGLNAPSVMRLFYQDGSPVWGTVWAINDAGVAGGMDLSTHTGFLYIPELGYAVDVYDYLSSIAYTSYYPSEDPGRIENVTGISNDANFEDTLFALVGRVEQSGILRTASDELTPHSRKSLKALRQMMSRDCADGSLCAQ